MLHTVRRQLFVLCVHWHFISIICVPTQPQGKKSSHSQRDCVFAPCTQVILACPRVTSSPALTGCSPACTGAPGAHGSSRTASLALWCSSGSPGSAACTARCVACRCREVRVHDVRMHAASLTPLLCLAPSTID
jgi:hypothetical protein